jgi:hypothetical protein
MSTDANPACSAKTTSKRAPLGARPLQVDIDVDRREPLLTHRGEEEAMIEVECAEMTVDEQLALASTISDGLAGKAVALIKDSKIVLDALSGEATPEEVERLVRDFASKRKDPAEWSVEGSGASIVVHSSDPLSRSRGRKDTGQMLPDNLFKCPFCPFVTPYEELYVVHYRSHGFA